MMKNKYQFNLIISVISGLGLALALLWLLSGGLPALAAPGSPASTTRYVAPGGNCGVASPCYGTPQTAVDAASPGDVIKVAQGDYTDIHVRAGITQVVYISKTVTVRGGYTNSDWETPDPATHPTTLDAKGQGRVLVIVGYGINPTIDGLRITGGDAAGLGGDPWGDDAGGGVYVNVATPAIGNNLIYSNTAYRGGGVFVNNAATLNGNTVSDNTADQGGGLYLYSSASALSANVIVSNTATTRDGGGLFLNSSNATLRNNVIADNRVSSPAGKGSGLFIYNLSPQLLHTTIARNSGGDGSGVYVDDSGGSNYSTVALTNTIMFSHTVGIAVTAGNTATLNATLWHANGTDRNGAGVINHTNDHSGDPAFKSDGYHLTPASAAIDQGVNAGVTTDIDGEVRPDGPKYDIGADEFVTVPPSGVTIAGPAQGDIKTGYTFTATVTPASTTTPLTYTWQATDQSVATVTGTLSSSIVFTWTTMGRKTITVTAANAGGQETGTHTITIGHQIYLPLVVRNH